MTVGSWNRDDFHPYAPTGGWTGVKWTRSWNGADATNFRPDTSQASIFQVHRRMLDAAADGPLESFKVRTPRYLRQAAAEERAVKRARRQEHAYSVTETRLSDEVVNAPGLNFPVPVMATYGVTTWAPATLLTANDQIRLVNKLREKLQGSDFNMSVFLGEGHQTLRLLGDSAIRIAKALHHARKLDVRGVMHSLFTGTSRKPVPRDWKTPQPKDAASIWLEFQYGWKPLLQDAAGAAEQLAHHLNVPAQTTHRVSVRRESLLFRDAQVGSFPTHRSVAASVRVHRRSLIARIDESPSVASLTGVLDPELVAWELLPFSFVADWFIPIGSWMEARALAGRLTGTFITSDKREGVAYTPQSAWFDHQCRATYRGVIFDRSISTTLKVPMPSFKPLSQVASWQHCANAVALLVGMASGHVPKMAYTD